MFLMNLDGRTLVLGDVGTLAIPAGGLSDDPGHRRRPSSSSSGGLTASGPPDGDPPLSSPTTGLLVDADLGECPLALDGGTLRFQSTTVENTGELPQRRRLLETMILLSEVPSLTAVRSGGMATRSTISNGSQFTNTGAIAPGALRRESGILPTVVTSGALPIGTEGRLEIELGGTEPGTGYDRLDVEGVVALSGELAISLLDGFTPELGQTFEVMTFTSRTGEFDTLTGTSLGNGLGLLPSYTDTSVILTVVEDMNPPPVAVDDAATTQEGVVVLIDVLANDSDPDGDELTIADVGNPANGTAEAVEGQISYTPSPGFAGTDERSLHRQRAMGTVAPTRRPSPSPSKRHPSRAPRRARCSRPTATLSSPSTKPPAAIPGPTTPAGSTPPPPLRDWQGVAVVGDRVTSLDLTENGLAGTIPLRSASSRRSRCSASASTPSPARSRPSSSA